MPLLRRNSNHRERYADSAAMMIRGHCSFCFRNCRSQIANCTLTKGAFERRYGIRRESIDTRAQAGVEVGGGVLACGVGVATSGPKERQTINGRVNYPQRAPHLSFLVGPPVFSSPPPAPVCSIFLFRLKEAEQALAFLEKIVLRASSKGHSHSHRSIDTSAKARVLIH